MVISMLVVEWVLRAEMSPWAPSHTQIPRLRHDEELPAVQGRWSGYTSSNGYDVCHWLVGWLMARLVVGFMAMLVAGLMAWLVAGFVARLVAGLSESVSVLMPKVVRLVLRVGVSPWALLPHIVHG